MEQQSLLLATDERLLIQTKRVHFASSPVTYNEIPWATSNPIIDDNISLKTDCVSLESCFKESNYQFRTQMKEDDRMSCVGIVVVILCLFFLFVTIWYVADKMLMIEIEKNVSESSLVGRSQSRLFRTS